MSGIILTRGVNSAKYEVAERVLCFEPDPTKVKVLYDAKILDIKWTRNESGKRVPEYYVHFNGWNRSWDRWAPEDFVMKHSAENSELQWRLQMEAEEKAFKGKKRRRKFDVTDNASKRSLVSESNSGDGESEDSSLSEGNPVEELYFEEDDDMIEEVPIMIPDQLKARLEDDCYAINCQDQLVKLPCEPTALSILEDYLQYFGVRHPVLDTQPVAGMAPEAVVPPPLPHQNFKVCREFLDGIRVLFDFLIYDHLLYESEKEQYHLHVTKHSKSNGGKKSKEDKPPTLEPMSLTQDNPPALVKMELNPDAEKQGSREDTPPRRITRRLSAINSKTSETTKPSKLDIEKQEAKKRPAPRHSRRIASLSSMPNSSPSCSPPAIAKEAPEYPSNPCPLVAQEIPKAEAPTKMPPKSPPPPPAEESQSPAETDKQPHPLFENLKLLANDATYNGQIPSCKVYGSIHLLRLFVKLPEVIAKMNLPPKKQKPLLKHAELFLRFLSRANEEHSFFPDNMYISSKQALKVQ